jgi:hypothetical protein
VNLLGLGGGVIPGERGSSHSCQLNGRPFSCVGCWLGWAAIADGRTGAVCWLAGTCR